MLNFMIKSHLDQPFHAMFDLIPLLIPLYIQLAILSRSSHRSCFVRKGVLRNFAKFTRKQSHRCFPVNFAKLLRTPFLQSASGRLLLIIVCFLLALNEVRPLFLCFYGWLWVCFCLPDSLTFQTFYMSTLLKNPEEASPRCSVKKMSCKISLPQKNTSNGVMYLIIVKGLGLQHYKKLFHLRLFFLLSFEKLFRTVIL